MICERPAFPVTPRVETFRGSKTRASWSVPHGIHGIQGGIDFSIDEAAEIPRRRVSVSATFEKVVSDDEPASSDEIADLFRENDDFFGTGALHNSWTRMSVRKRSYPTNVLIAQKYPSMLSLLTEKVDDDAASTDMTEGGKSSYNPWSSRNMRKSLRRQESKKTSSRFTTDRFDLPLSDSSTVSGSSTSSSDYSLDDSINEIAEIGEIGTPGPSKGVEWTKTLSLVELKAHQQKTLELLAKLRKKELNLIWDEDSSLQQQLTSLAKESSGYKKKSKKQKKKKRRKTRD
mmetsp:Transcript_36947/g.56761  ORF Transcript_36947/g.56761 Transcript_36947/m.56761 type:complete len:288 (-) Transcript_36947:302-1165(-)